MCVRNLVVGGADMDSRNRDGETPLHLAAAGNHLGAVEELLSAGASFDIRRFFTDYTALDVAAQQGHVDVVRALIRNGKDVTVPNQYGFTTLHHAVDSDGARRDRVDVVRVLLGAGADIEAKTETDGPSPLHIAASQPYESRVCALLEGGARIDARDFEGATPLPRACSNTCFSVVKSVIAVMRGG